jgi:hypothetical protein
VEPDEARRRWAAAEAQDLGAARAASDALTLGERAEQAIALLILTLQELAARAADPEELLRLLAADEPDEPDHSPAAVAARRRAARR